MKNNNLTKEALIEHVKLAINPHFKDWVLFKNGTYIIIENLEKGETIEALAMQKMKEFGPIHVGSPAGDFNTITLNKTEGWVIAGHGYGMYTYVHPSEVEDPEAQDYVIGLFGRNKRDEDGQHPEIIYVNRA